jgi:fluoroacetyl-CoA thioesterase
MKNIFEPSDIKSYTKVVTIADIAAFDSGIVHEVYSTFSLTRDAEWCGRLFVLDMLEPHEQGIGTSITVQHISPAFIGDTIIFTGVFIEINAKNEIITKYTATVENRTIAYGIQGQKILPVEKINSIFSSLKN